MLLCSSALALIALAAPAAAQTPAPVAASQPTRAMTEVDLATLKRVGAPTVSADGRWVVYQMTETDPVSFARSTGLWLVDLNAPNARPVRVADTADKNENSPAFHPGGFLFFISDASGSDQLWRVDLNSMNTPAVQVSDTKADVAGFRLSPDGTKVLMWGDIAMECTSFGCDAKDKGAAPGPGTGRHYRDGVGFVRHWDSWETPGTHSRAFVFDLVDGKAVAPRAMAADLVGDTPSKPFGGGEETAWAADSKSVFLTLRRADRNEPTSTNLDIWHADAATGAAHNATPNNAATDTLPAPSPDGKWLAYAAMARPGYEADRQVLMLRDLKTGTVRALTQDWDRSVGSISWSPDSKLIYVTAQDVLDHPAFTVTLKGKVTRLKLNPAATEGTVNDVTPLAKGALVYTLNSVANPTDVWMRRANGNLVNLSVANGDVTPRLHGITTQRFSFKGADGDTVWGQIHTSNGQPTPTPRPTLLWVHGGPQGSFGNGWSTRWNPRVFAEQGYTVVSIDFHGSTGYGQAFTDSINRDWGGKPLEDLKLGMAAAAKASPLVAPDNACAMGGSYGGYMMNWIAGNWPDGFKCLVNHAGVFDLRAMAFETEELWFDEWDHGGPWWTRSDPEKWNPVNHVTKWKTPMLVIHGEKDFRIPYSQGLAAFTALQRQGVPGELLVFPDENHWILKGKNSVQWHRTTFDWLNRHLTR